MDMHALPIETVIKLVIAMLLGMSLGLERLYAHKNAGMRTYALVALAAAFFVTISETVASGSFSSVDRMRMASQIIVGVGFLGGGLIFMKDDKIANLTTAAGLWVAAAIGVAVGFGLYFESVIATLLTLFILSVLAMIERKFKERIAIHDGENK